MSYEKYTYSKDDMITFYKNMISKTPGKGAGQFNKLGILLDLNGIERTPEHREELIEYLGGAKYLESLNKYKKKKER